VRLGSGYIAAAFTKRIPITTPSSQKLRWLLFFALAALALLVRLPQLAQRPMHTDEAVNAYITGQLLAGEAYHYDNVDRHGPALYALAVPLAWLAGAKDLPTLDETTLRLGPVLVGALTVLLFALIVPETGLAAALIAALLWAVAALPVFYSRYFIHETLFSATTFGFLLGGWRWLNTASLAGAALTGLTAALLLAGKETAVLSFAGAAAAVAWWWFERRWLRNEHSGNPAPVFIRWKAVALALGFFLVAVALLFSWGGQNWQALADLFRAGPHTLNRAAGQGHEKPAAYYLQLIGHGWSGRAFLVLTLFGAASVAVDGWRTFRRLPRHPLALRLCLVYALAIGVIYSAIPYKTPWLALNLWLPWSVLAAVGAAALWRSARFVAVRAGLVLGAASVLLATGYDTRQWVFCKLDSEKNPYAYSQPGEDLLRLQEFFSAPPRQDAHIAVIGADAWPLPWYLRHCPRVGYWQPGQDPGQADYYITLPDAAEQLQPKLPGWRPDLYGVRPGVLLVVWLPPDFQP